MIQPFVTARHLTILTFCLFSVCGLFSALATAAPLEDFEAVYKAKFRGIGVTATRKLETLADGKQRLTFSADSILANLKETSEFTWNENSQIIPSLYTYNRGGLGRDRQARLEFDWTQNRVTNHVQDKPWKMKIPNLALDKLSFQLQLRADLIERGRVDTYEIADGGRLKKYTFEMLGEEAVKTPAGKFNAVKIKRVREGKEEERQTIFWLAKDWDYLVIRLQQTEDDKSYEIDLHHATVNGKKVTGIK